MTKERRTMALRTFRDLDAWNVGMTVVELTYGVARLLPSEERYELSAQMRKAAVSIPSNVAEGFARGTARVCVHFVRIALGSTSTDHGSRTRRGSYT
jgi:hypothetical protein